MKLHIPAWHRATIYAGLEPVTVYSVTTGEMVQALPPCTRLVQTAREVAIELECISAAPVNTSVYRFGKPHKCDPVPHKLFVDTPHRDIQSEVMEYMRIRDAKAAVRQAKIEGYDPEDELDLEPPLDLEDLPTKHEYAAFVHGRKPPKAEPKPEPKPKPKAKPKPEPEPDPETEGE